jgi:hypothetical protein
MAAVESGVLAPGTGWPVAFRAGRDAFARLAELDPPAALELPAPAVGVPAVETTPGGPPDPLEGPFISVEPRIACVPWPGPP